MKKKDERIYIRLNSQDKAELKKIALSEGMSVSQLIRNAFLTTQEY